MIHSTALKDLHPYVAELAQKLIDECQAEGLDLLVTSTYRDLESQAVLYAQGRSAPGRTLTANKPGASFHNYRCAFDVVPLSHGKPLWVSDGPYASLWSRIGAMGEALGLEWGGKWSTNREVQQFQYTGGLSLADFQAGKTLNDVLEQVVVEVK